MSNRRTDLALACLCALVAFTYLWSLPRNLNPSDEAVHLYEAKRLLSGEVMYRDIFEIITPGWMYFIAAVFWLFGTDIDTARIAMAVVHAGAVVLIGLTCRRIGVRPGLAWTAAFAYLVLCQAAWPIASQHWLSTFLCLVVLFLLATPQRTRRTFLWAGLFLGCVVAVQQQRGVIMAGGIAAWAVADALLHRPATVRVRDRLLALGLGISVIMVPLLITVVLMAGVAPVWRALVIHPLFNYRTTTHAPWGFVGLFTLEYVRLTFVQVLVWLPLVLGLTGVRLMTGLMQRTTTGPLAQLLLLLVMGLSSIASIAYFPDFIHIAFITPIVLIAVAESAEWLIGTLPTTTARRVATIVTTAAIVVVCADKLVKNSAILKQTYPLAQDTAFGRVAMQTPRDVELYKQVNELLDGVPSRVFYSYPIIAHFYLIANATNPTRYGFFLATYNAPDQIQEVLDTLTARRVPYIVSLPTDLMKDDPVVAYIAREYEPLAETVPPGFRVFRRRGA